MQGSIGALLLVLATQLQPASPPRVTRDEPPPRTGTAVIRGRITERDTDVPIAQMDVRLYSLGLRGLYQTRTDDQGRFEFRRLPADQYRVQAEPAPNRAAYLQGAFVEKAVEPGGSPKPLLLAEGEVREGVDIALVRLVVITGHVLDDYGLPLSDVRVSAEPLSSKQGISTFRGRDTDDRGTFRLFGLAPGRYRLCADPGSNFDHRSVDSFVRTCYPSTLAEDDSPAVSVATGESGDIDIRMIRTRVFTLAGTILDASGAPAPRAYINVSRIVKNGSSGGRGWQVDETGRFTMSGLPPGDYGIRAQIGGQSSPYRDDDNRELQAGYVELALASNVENLVVATAKPAKLAGRVSFDDSTPQRPLDLKVRAVNVPRIHPERSAPVRADLTFELNGLFGQQILIVEGLGRDWVVKSVRYQKDNVTGLPVEYKSSADPDDLQIVLTSRGGRIVARVVDESGKPANDARVIFFPVDPRQWNTAWGSLQYGIRQKDGSYTVGLVRAGEYFVAATAPEDIISMPDRPQMEALAKAAERITLSESEERQIELRVVRIP